jgi:Holliday junction DNA helicase RuvA
MYSYIKGKLVEKNPAYAVLENEGIGYMINISLHTYTQLKSAETFKLYTHLAIKNEATTPVGFVLFGFADEKERELFRLLISVSGVGNNTALLMLSSLSPNNLVEAIVDGNAAALQAVKGIGGKTAQRIVIDLKDKLEKGKISQEIIKTSYNTNKEEALSGLTVLGFNKNKAEAVLKKIIDKQGAELPVEELIKEALKAL